MSKDEMPTAEEWLKSLYNVNSSSEVAMGGKLLTDKLIEFAKLHVKAALEDAAKRTIDLHHDVAKLDQDCNDYEEAAKKYIKESYPLDKIK